MYSHLHIIVYRRQVTGAAQSSVLGTYAQLHAAVVAPGNGYEAGTLGKTPDMVRQLLGIEI